MTVQRKCTSSSDWSHRTTPGSSQLGSDWCWLQVVRLRPTACAVRIKTLLRLSRASYCYKASRYWMRIASGCENIQLEPLVRLLSAHVHTHSHTDTHAHGRTIQHLGQRASTVREINRWLSPEPQFSLCSHRMRAARASFRAFFRSEQSDSIPSVGAHSAAWLNLCCAEQRGRGTSATVRGAGGGAEETLHL